MAQAISIPPPKPVNLENTNATQNWNKFKDGWKHYSIATELKKKDKEVQASILMSVMGEECREVVNNLELSADEKKDPESIITKLSNHFDPKKNTIYERYVFNTCTQEPDETYDSYFVRLRKLASTCEYPNTDDFIRDRMVIGIKDSNVRMRLLREADLTLTKTLDIVRAHERAQQQVKDISSGSTDDAKKIQFVKQKRSKEKKPDFKTQLHNKKKQEYKCTRCGNIHVARQCPAYRQKCGYCRKEGHFKECCYKLKKKVHDVEVQESDTDSDYFIGAVENTSKSNKEKDWSVKVKINNQGLKLKLDTGADCNIISSKVLESLRISDTHLAKSKSKLIAYTGNRIKIKGKIELEVEHKNKLYPIMFYVTESDHTSILGRNSCVELGVVQRVYELKQEKMTKEKLLDDYSDIFHGLGKLPVEYHIEIDESVKPVISPPRRVPEAIRDKVKKELDRMEKMDVIEKVNGHTPWVSNMVTRIKKDKVRICLDPSNLNKAIKREHYPMNTVEEVAARMPKATKFTVLDASKGFWQVPLDEESSKLCTMATPWGRYRFKRMPFGLNSSSEVYQKIMKEMLDDVENVDVIVDDIVIGEEDDDDDSTIIEVLNRCRENNIKLNKDKIQFRVEQVTYSGHILTKEGIKPDPEKITAITQMTEPKNIAELQRFLGMTTYMSKFIKNYSTISAPLRELLEKEVEWHWDIEQVNSFNQLKTVLTEAPVLVRYDVTKPVTMATDASGLGLGAVLYQEGHPVAYSSKSLTNAQKNYVSIEREMLALVHGCTKFHNYIFGKNTVVKTDHKPLEAIMKKNIAQCPARLQNMRMILQKYDITVVYEKGTSDEIKIPDTLSRASIMDTMSEFEDDLQVCMVINASDDKLDEIRLETEKDSQLQTLANIIHAGWPEKLTSIPDEVKVFWNFRDEISMYNGILFKAEQMIIPLSLRKEMLAKLHSAHSGINACQNRARQIIYWPNINKDIQELVEKCRVCNKFKPNQIKEEMIIEQLPELPWQKVGTDLFELDNKHYCVLADYYSNFIEVTNMQETSSKAVINVLKAQFARHGIPQILKSDNGPQYTSSEFKKFSKQYGFEHQTSSPRYPKSNGLAESAVKTIKNILIKAKESDTDPYLALLQYRNTPRDNLGSPAQRLFNRQTKTTLPVTETSLKPKIIPDVSKNLLQCREQQKKYYDRNARIKNDNFKKGDSVRYQMSRGENWKLGQIVNQDNRPRSFTINTEEGRNIQRNTSMLRKTREEYKLKPRNDVDIDITVPENCTKRIPKEKPPDPPCVTRSGRISKLPAKFNDYELAK